jgi:hypothetical protein
MRKTALLALAVTLVSGPSLARVHRHDVYRHRWDHHAYAYRHRSDHHAYADAHRHAWDHRDSVRKPEAAGTAHAQITCGMVRAYVAQVGLSQARAMALSAGMTAAEERRARRCLENGA